MFFLLIVALAVLFPAIHIFNGWLFDFATINAHISLIYLPAFLRLFNVLVLGPIWGTVTTFLGSILLMSQFDEPLGYAMLNNFSTCAGPLIALFVYQYQLKRPIQLNSLKDVSVLTLYCSLGNSLVHHMVWYLQNTSSEVKYLEAMWMFVGDLLGTLIGAYIMKGILDLMAYRQSKLNSEAHKDPQNPQQ
jgi:hypothetical protein